MDVRSTQLDLDSGLGLVLFDGQPLKVGQLVAPTADQCLPVVYLPARAGARLVAGARAWVETAELGFDCRRSLDGPRIAAEPIRHGAH